MPTYILLSTLTPEGRMTLHSNPDRLDEVNQEIEDFGCKVVAQYAVLGLYDFVSVIEAEDNATIAHLALDLGLARDGEHRGSTDRLAPRVARQTQGTAPDWSFLTVVM